MRAFVISILFVVACGPGRRDDTGDGSGSGSGSNACPECSFVTGKVYAPNYGPDQKPGQEIPVFGATIYVTDKKPDPIPQNVFCEPCVETPQGATKSSHDGSFNLKVEGTGDYWLVIQKGPFRLEQRLGVTVGTTTLPPSSTTLPSKLDPENGAWIPKVAIARGNFDAVEDILGKLGFGTMGGDNHLATTDNEITFYSWTGTGNMSATYLLSNISELRKYHIVFFPCSTEIPDDTMSTLLTDQNKLKNLRQYVAEGGKVYVTDWSGEVGDRTFPPQLELGQGTTDSIGTYDPVTFAGTLTQKGDADGAFYDAADGKAIDPDLNMWLGLQSGPTEDNPTPMMYNANAFNVTHNWNIITKLNSVMKGKDEQGNPIYDDPKPWLTGTDDNGHNGPLAVTYEPAGCGKVLYSTFQTSGASADDSHIGLAPQERVLLFLIMEISSCTENPIIL